jgi:hypothetical protein
VPHATPREPFGPVAAPGSYTVRLTVDGRHLEAPLALRADPRVTLSADGYAAELSLARRLAAGLTEATRALGASRSLREQLKAVSRTGPAADVIQAIDARLAALLDAPQAGAGTPAPRLPGVQGEIEELYGAVNRADAAPTTAQLKASDAAVAALAPLLAAWRGLEAELPALNAHLKAAGLAVLRPELALPADRDLADEE